MGTRVFRNHEVDPFEDGRPHEPRKPSQLKLTHGMPQRILRKAGVSHCDILHRTEMCDNLPHDLMESTTRARIQNKNSEVQSGRVHNRGPQLFKRFLSRSRRLVVVGRTSASLPSTRFFVFAAYGEIAFSLVLGIKPVSVQITIFCAVPENPVSHVNVKQQSIARSRQTGFSFASLTGRPKTRQGFMTGCHAAG